MSFKLAKIFGNHMVLQRDVPVKIWGEADYPVTVSVDMHSAVDFARDGKFCLTIPPHKAGGPYTMFIESEGRVEKLHDLYFGDVFLAGGQSNMGLTLPETDRPLDECDGVVRIFTPDREWEYDKRPKTDDRWVDICMDNADGISAVASHFAISLNKTYGVPIGIVSCNQGATCIRSWIAPDTVEKDPIFGPDTQWHEDATIFPFNPPSHQYNERLVKVAPYTIKGVIWYQGESDADSPIAHSYKQLFDLMVADWRRLWCDPDLPFITVQLTYHTPGRPTEIWEILREQQLCASLEGHNIGMITIGDAGDLPNIHPTNKKVVGDRLALYARGLIYGEDILHRPPVCREMTVDGEVATLTFSDAGDGLYETESHKFFVIDADGKSHEAAYEICGDKVKLHAEGIIPVEVRFCFDAESAVYLYSSAGLPASPFRISVK